MNTNTRQLTFSSDDLAFAGTLTLPDGAGPFPAALLIPGSGQVDRDENAKRAKLQVFKDLAEHLATLGLASYRYDKRGVGESEGDYWSCGFHDNRRDAAAAFNALSSHPDVQADQIFLVGHSEGTFHAARLAAEGLPVAGVVLIASAARSGEKCLLWQGRAVADSLSGVQRWLIKTLKIDVSKQQRKMFKKIRSSDKDVVRQQLLVRLNARWLREFLDYDPTDDLRVLSVPALAITGTEDLQTPPEDLETMAALNERIETVLMPGISHLLRHTDGGGLKDYRRQLKTPIADEPLELVGQWLVKRVNGKVQGE